MSTSHELQIETESDITLAGTLTLPEASGKGPAVVAVHGASEGTRESPLFQHLASLLPEHSVATLVFDRRGEGASTGSLAGATFEDLAADVQSWVNHLGQHPGIDAAKIGVWCHSQGGWIASLVAAAGPDLAFLIAVSPSGVTAAEQMTYAASYALREAGYPESVVATVTNLRCRLDDHYRGHLSRDDARALVDAVRTEPWFDLAFLPDPARSESDRWRSQMDFDIRPSLRRLALPILLIFGDHDRWVPVEPSLAAWRSALGPDAPLTVAIIPGGGHFPTLAANPHDWDERGPISSDYERILLSWLRDR